MIQGPYKINAVIIPPSRLLTLQYNALITSLSRCIAFNYPIHALHLGSGVGANYAVASPVDNPYWGSTLTLNEVYSMNCTYKGALTSAPKFLTAFMLSIFLVACGGGTSGDGTTAGTDVGLDTSGDTDLDGDFGLDTDGTVDPDEGFIDGDTLDSDGNGFTDAQEALDCWGLNGEDEDSSNYLWNDNCHLSELSPFATSTYSQGIQRVLYCSGLGGTFQTTAAFADGIFGPGTAEAVRAFQAAENEESTALADGRAPLAVDGIVGPQTWDRLQSRVLNADAFIAVETNLGVDSEVLGVSAPTYPGVASVNCTAERNFIGLINADQEIDSWRLTDAPGGTGVNSFSIARP